MILTAIDCDHASIHVSFGNGVRASFPHIWLRDNDPAGFHPVTHERTFDLTTVALDIRPKQPRFTANSLLLRWPDEDAESVFDAGWLYRHRPGVPRADAAAIEQQTWTADTLGTIPRFSAKACRDSAAELGNMLAAFKSHGIVIIDQLDDDPMAGEAFGDLIGFKRRTNFGVMFDVVNKPDANNLAYTALSLPLHTDLPNQDYIPGAQFLHCIANSAEGGDSVFADGFQICQDLAREEPDAFETLKRITLPWRFFDDTCDIVSRWPVITQRADGQFDAFTFNAHIADVPDLETDEMLQFYAAYQNLMHRVRSEKYRVEYRLQPGEMVMMANKRVLHGRTGFDPASGYRHLRGYYIDLNEINSCLRVIERSASA